MGCLASKVFSCIPCCYYLPGGPMGPRVRTASFIRVVTFAGPRVGAYDIPRIRAHANLFGTLGFTEGDITRLSRQFSKIDADGSGEISLDELLDFLDVPRTRFAKRVFSIFDEDMSGEIDFKEFVVAMWNYCTMGKSALVLFAFDLFDSDSSGMIEREEMVRMLKDIYGKAFTRSSLAQKIYRQLTGGKGAAVVTTDLPESEISVSQFETFCKTHPAMLHPAFVFQWELQHRCLGPHFWHKKAHTRLSLTEDGKSTNVIEFLKTQVNESAFKSLIEEPFNQRTGSIPTDEDLANLGTVMEGAGSVAQRRFNKGVTAAIAMSNFNKEGKENKNNKKTSKSAQSKAGEKEKKGYDTKKLPKVKPKKGGKAMTNTVVAANRLSNEKRRSHSKKGKQKLAKVAKVQKGKGKGQVHVQPG